MYRDVNRDRDDNGIPDWQEDENYRDEAPRGAPVGGGCLLSLASLAVVAGALVRVARASRLPVARLPEQPQRAAVAADLLDVDRLAHHAGGGALP